MRLALLLFQVIPGKRIAALFCTLPSTKTELSQSQVKSYTPGRNIKAARGANHKPQGPARKERAVWLCMELSAELISFEANLALELRTCLHGRKGATDRQEKSAPSRPSPAKKKTAQHDLLQVLSMLPLLLAFLSFSSNSRCICHLLMLMILCGSCSCVIIV